MTEQTDAAEVELGYLLARNMNNLYGTRDRVQAAILASDWLAAREAAATERALREAADAYGPAQITYMGPADGYVKAWLRARAAQVAPSRVPGEGS